VGSGCAERLWKAAVLRRLCPVAVAEAVGIGCPDMAGRRKRLCLEVAVGAASRPWLWPMAQLLLR
jgi:hypothetical protein